MGLDLGELAVVVLGSRIGGVGSYARTRLSVLVVGGGRRARAISQRNTTASAAIGGD